MSLSITKYNHILAELKEKIRTARLKAVLSVNVQLLAIYHEIGRVISEQEKAEGWGAKTVERLSVDLKTEFQDMQGLSLRNLRYMRDFCLAYPQLNILQQDVAKIQKKDADTILQQAVAKLPWGHHIVILTKVKAFEERKFYIQKCIENNWSRDILSAQIESGLHKRTGAILNNFSNTLTDVHSDLAVATFKNPYVFDFLAMGEKMYERDLEKALIAHLKDFMLELGKGFAYFGNQYQLDVDGDEYIPDLVFYNSFLHCYVLFELKIGDFEPEFTGKLNFYINAFDAQVKKDEDKPTIGVLLCKTPNETVVKYALQGVKTPMGVSSYKLADALPKQLKSGMPTIQELEREVEESYEELKSPSENKLDHLKELIRGLKQPPAKDKRTPQAVKKIFTDVVLPLRDGIKRKLKEISKEFHQHQFMIWTDNQGHKTDEEVANYLKEHKEVGEFKIDITLRGFKPAGTKAFDIWKYLVISTNPYNYTIALEKHGKEILVDKVYHQLPDKKEFADAVEKCSETVIDNITQQIERIKGIKK